MKSQAEAFVIACIACDGKPFWRDGSVCGVCGGREVIEIEGCPRKGIDAGVYPAIEAYAILTETKTWPNGRGWLDEPQILIDAVRFLKCDDAMSGVISDG